MQHEGNYMNHYNDVLQNQDFEKFFWKIVYAILVFDVLDNNIYLYIVVVNKVLLLVHVLNPLLEQSNA